jgi:predicted TPR repeat methyltransferase
LGTGYCVVLYIVNLLGHLLLEHVAGSGLSGDCLTEAGHHWIGCDISKDMLVVAKEQETEGDVVLNDMGQVRGDRERGEIHLNAMFIINIILYVYIWL